MKFGQAWSLSRWSLLHAGRDCRSQGLLKKQKKKISYVGEKQHVSMATRIEEPLVFPSWISPLCLFCHKLCHILHSTWECMIKFTWLDMTEPLPDCVAMGDRWKYHYRNTLLQWLTGKMLYRWGTWHPHIFIPNTLIPPTPPSLPRMIHLIPVV